MQIAKLIEKMAQRGVERAVLVSDQPMRLSVAGRETAGPVMSRQQLQAVLEEVAPENVLTQINAGEKCQFLHQSHGADKRL